MTFEEILTQVHELLERQGRVSYRALKRRFELDDDYLEDVKAELIDAQRVAADEDGKVLIWTGAAGTAPGSDGNHKRDPLSYTPIHLVEKILNSRQAVEGERKQVTVLFADLKGSMELLADRDPEEARRLLDPVLERMMEAVHRYEGTVNQVLGDGIMALFGAPLAHEDHAMRACYAALSMQDAIGRYARGAAARAGTGRADPGRAQLGRGRRPLDRQRSPHGLHGGGPDDAPGRAHGAARAPGDDADHREHASPGRGLRRGHAARARAAQGPRERRRDLRAGPGSTPAVSLARRRRAGAQPVRRARRRDGAAPAGPRASRRRARPGRGRHRGARRGEVPPLLRVRPFPSRPGMVRPRELLRVVREGDRVPAGHRSPQDVLPGRGPRRRAHDPRQGHRARADARREPAGHHPGPPRAARRAPRGQRVSVPRSRPATAAHARRLEAPAAAGEPGPAAAGGVREPPLDRLRDAGLPQQPHRQPSDGAPPAARQLSPRVSARVGKPDLLHAAPPRSAASRERGRAAARAPGRRCQPAVAEPAPDRAHGGESLLPRGERPRAGRDAGAGRRARGLSAGPVAPGDPGPGHGAGRAGGPYRSAAIGRKAAAPDRGGGRDGGAVSASPGRRRRARGGPAAGPHLPAGGRVPLRDAPLSRAGIHLQARADLSGGLREPPAGAAARAPHPDHGGAGGAERRPPRRARRPARPPCIARRGLGEGRRLSHSRRATRPRRARPMSRRSAT